MKQNRCKTCGGSEFVTKPNHYDIYEIVNGKLIFQRTEPINTKLKLFCRDCSEKLELREKNVTIE